MWLAAVVFTGGLIYWVGLISAHRMVLVMGASVLVLALGVMFLGGHIDTLGVVLLIAMALLGYGLRRCSSSVVSVIGWVIFLVVTLALGFRVLPFFTPADALLTVEYAFRLPPEKVLLMLLVSPMVLVAWSVTKESRLRVHRVQPFWVAVSVLIGTLALIIPLGLWSGFVKFGIAQQSVAFLTYWLTYNLLYTCVLEEGLFRGILQTALIRGCSRRFPIIAAHPMGIFGAALLFGVAHSGGGWTYAMLATLAGMGYGLVYEMTGRLHYAVLVHFGVNVVHRLLFAGFDSGI